MTPTKLETLSNDEVKAKAERFSGTLMQATLEASSRRSGDDVQPWALLMQFEALSGANYTVPESYRPMFSAFVVEELSRNVSIGDVSTEDITRVVDAVARRSAFKKEAQLSNRREDHVVAIRTKQLATLDFQVIDSVAQVAARLPQNLDVKIKKTPLGPTFLARDADKFPEA